jgi:hypothetical protein
MKRIDKYFPKLILSIVLVLSLVGTEGLIFAKNYLFCKETYIEAAEKNDVPAKVMDSIEKYFKDSYNYSSIPEDIYTSAISEEDIMSFIELKITSVFDYVDGTESKIKETEFDLSQIESSVSEFFMKFASENNVEIDDAYNQQLQKTIDTAKNEIDNFSDVYMLDMIQKTGAFSKLRTVYKLLTPAIIGMVVFTGLCLVLLLLLCRKRISGFLYWLSVSVMCSSAIAIIPCLIMKFSGYVDRLVIRNDYIYSAVTGVINGTLSKYIAVQAVLFAAAVVIMIIYGIIPKSKNNE